MSTTHEFLDLWDEEPGDEAIRHHEDVDLLFEGEPLESVSSAWPEEDIFDLLAIALL